jgi:hypothetical protein
MIFDETILIDRLLTIKITNILSIEIEIGHIPIFASISYKE